MNIKANIEDTRKGFEESFASGDFYNRQTRQEYPNQIITLNSSSYGVTFYHALGFTDTDKEQTVNGIWFTPMKYEDFAEDGD